MYNREIKNLFFILHQYSQKITRYKNLIPDYKTRINSRGYNNLIKDASNIAKRIEKITKNQNGY